MIFHVSTLYGRKELVWTEIIELQSDFLVRLDTQLSDKVKINLKEFTNTTKVKLNKTY